jgi:predicted nucleotidyltransferase component of viral defense system
MAKRTFSQAEWLHLTELAHAALLSGLMSVRRWAPDELKFQGGTSLHLMYGSPRFSEDLDFITATTKGLHAAVRDASTHIRASMGREFPQISVAIRVRDEEGVPDPRNPRLFTLSLSEPDWYEVLKVKVEFFVVEDKLAQLYASELRQTVHLRPRLQVDIAPFSLEVAVLEEILADKIHALGDRARLKERDVFDLWWICQQAGLTPANAAANFVHRHAHHMAMYPRAKPLPELAQSLRERAAQVEKVLTDPAAFAGLVQSIARWLPAAGSLPNPLASDASVRAMALHAVDCGLEAAQAVEDLLQGDDEETALARARQGRCRD